MVARVLAMVRHRVAIAVFAALAAPGARAQQIVHAVYDGSRDVLLVDIAYRGSRNDHSFAVEWGACLGGTPNETSARLSDLDGHDAALHDYHMRLRIGLDDLQCRPVRATLRLGRTSHATVLIPEAP